MKDLKHLYEFEKLLESANNALVQQACAEGKHALAYTCYHMPEVLLNTGNCFSVRLRAPLTGSLDISSYYMSNFICDYCKSLLERGIEGGYNFLSGLMGTETCSEMNRALEHFELLQLVDNEQFFVTFLDMPFKVTENTVRHYVDQLRRKVLTPLQEVYGVDVSDDALRKAVAEHNEVCRILTEIGQFRKEENPRITGYEYHILNLVSYCCPKYLIVEKLRETLEELRQREPDVKPRFRVKIAVVDHDERTRILDELGEAGVVDLAAGARGNSSRPRPAGAREHRAPLPQRQSVPALHAARESRRPLAARARPVRGVSRAGRAVRAAQVLRILGL